MLVGMHVSVGYGEVCFAFTHTYTLEKLTLLLFFPKRTRKILKNVQNAKETRPKIGLKWCARGALLIFLVIFTKAIHILMLYLGFWHATIKRIHNFSKDLLRSQKIGSQKSCEISKKCYGSQKNNWISKYYIRSQKILWDLKKSCDISKNLVISQKILWDLKKMLWISKK